MFSPYKHLKHHRMCGMDPGLRRDDDVENESPLGSNAFFPILLYPAK